MTKRTFSDLTNTEKILLPLNSICAVVDLYFSIPVLGRVSVWLWNSILTLVHGLAGLFELLLWQAGFRPKKKLRIGFLILSKEDGTPLASPAELTRALNYIQQAYKPAKIEIVPAFPPPKRLSESGEEDEILQWTRDLSPEDSARVRRVGCDREAILQDLGLPGTSYQYHTLRQAFHSSFQRISGYAAPLMVFVVEDLSGFGGCSMGWLSDYVTVKTRSLRTTAHELGHACNLLHHKGEDNLMNPSSPHLNTVTLTGWQIALMRASRHVTMI
jgi:hypothetical protein